MHNLVTMSTKKKPDSNKNKDILVTTSREKDTLEKTTHKPLAKSAILLILQISHQTAQLERRLIKLPLPLAVLLKINPKDNKL